MRIPPERLAEITGRKRARAQALWFRDYLSVDVPCDRRGPIVTDAAYEAIVARACGLRADAGFIAESSRPQVQLRAVRK